MIFFLLMICPIYFQNIKKIKKLECSHKFCYYCILEWYEKDKGKNRYIRFELS